MMETKFNDYTKEDLEAALEAAGAVKQATGWCCPWHDDRTASAGVYERDGKWRFYCQRCERGADLYDLTGGQSMIQEEAQPRAEKRVDWKTSTLDAIKAKWQRHGLVIDRAHHYTNPRTNATELSVYRLHDAQGKKTYRQVIPYRGEWLDHGISELLPIKPIYNRRRVRDADMVVVVEGEKCVEALHDIGIVATTSPMGAGKADKADWLPLKGKRVVLWPDNDEAGVAHMDQVANCLRRIDCEISTIDPAATGLSEKGDAADYIEGKTHEQARADVSALLWQAPKDNPSGDYLQRIEETAQGRRRVLPMPWDRIRSATRALSPGTLTLLGAEPGAGKSLSVLQMVRCLVANGVPCSVLMMEDDRPFHMTRAHAQVAADASFADPDWVEMNAERVKADYLRNKAELDAISESITCDDRIETFAHAKEWAKRELERGCRALFIDPMTAFDGKDMHLEQKSFLRETLKPMLRQYAAAAVLVTHPKQQGGKGMGGIAGSANMARFVDTVLWLYREHQGASVTIEREGGGTQPEVCNARCVVLKSRSGKGAGYEYAMRFDGSALEIREMGRIVAHT